MDIQDVIRKRRSVRAFAPEPVARDTLARLIDAAVHAPSAVNAQPWHFTVMRDQALLDHISTESKRHMLALIDAGKELQSFRAHLIDPGFHVFYHAPAVILIATVKSDAWAHEDAALAAENLMLEAFAEGLGSCWIGFAQRWLETDAGKKAVGLPDEYQPVAPIIVGFPAEPAADVARNPPVIHWIG